MEIWRVLYQRGIGCKRESLLQEFEVDTETAYEALRTIVAPSNARRIDTPHPPHFLFGVEAGAGHAVTARKTQRMLCRSTMPAAYGSREQQQVLIVLHHLYRKSLFMPLLNPAADGAGSIRWYRAVVFCLGFLARSSGTSVQAQGFTFFKRCAKAIPSLRERIGCSCR